MLKGKTCIVTGAGKGFGRALAQLFRDNGARLALITRSREDASLLEHELGMDPESLLIVCGDVSDVDIVGTFVESTIKKFGGVDVLVNNAGMRFRKKFLDITTDEFARVMEVNLHSIVHLCQAVLPHMVRNGHGKIINMSSVAGTLGLPELSGYVTSKAAIVGLTKALAVEFAEKNIQVNAIAPGFCKTSYFENFKKQTELYEFTLNMTPMRRWGESAEIANVCLFLASSLSDYITGDVISVDGGWSAW